MYKKIKLLLLRCFCKPHKFFADSWGSEFVNIDKAGHINVSSRHTYWDEGMQILKKLD
ncbi:alpha/beta hydrolase [Fulvivirga sediminis]|uniref:alpha/beta hydrolase n=1 Tax=Fulvivirga sediminis TaxID=2803949 RepID=UPI003743E4D1